MANFTKYLSLEYLNYLVRRHDLSINSNWDILDSFLNAIRFNTIREVTATETLSIDDRTVIITPAADMVLTLPSAARSYDSETLIGQIVNLKRTFDTTGYTVTIDGDGTETIDNEVTQRLWAGECFDVQSDGTEWHVVRY